MSKLNYGHVVKRSDDDFVIFPNFECEVGYNVVPKSIDGDNKYDIEDVRLYCEEHPEMVIHETDDAVDIGAPPADVVDWLNVDKQIKKDLAYLRKTDDVGYQLARHERGTQTLSSEKYAECLEVDFRRGEIASGLKQRKLDHKAELESLKQKYSERELAVWGAC